MARNGRPDRGRSNSIDATAVTPAGVNSWFDHCRGYRFAQPPANSFHPSGVKLKSSSTRPLSLVHFAMDVRPEHLPANRSLGLLFLLHHRHELTTLRREGRGPFLTDGVEADLQGVPLQLE